MEEPILTCVRCGLEMVEIARQLPTRWSVRVGVHAGSVIAGVVGNRQYLFELWGDTVNTAARIESQGAPDYVNVSALAWEQIRDHCHGESLGRVILKGKGPTETYRVTGLHPEARR